MTGEVDLKPLGPEGQGFRFADWPVDAVPLQSAGVYTVWRENEFLYVGMAGRAMGADDFDPLSTTTAKGLRNRLNSHWSGRRSGDQFCVYICDRFVVPNLTPEQQRDVGTGALSLDLLTRELIRAELTFRFLPTTDGQSAFRIEEAIRRGALTGTRPILNPKGN